MADLALAHREEAKQRRTLVTPEGVDLSLSLADPWQRVGAFFFDLLVDGVRAARPAAPVQHRRRHAFG